MEEEGEYIGRRRDPKGELKKISKTCNVINYYY